MASRAYNLEEFVEILANWGLRDVMVPFLLFFVIFYAMFLKTKVLGEKSRINGVAALAISLLVVIPHVVGKYPANFNPVEIVNQALPNISIIKVAAIAAIILIGAFGGQISTRPAYLTGGVILMGSVIYLIFVYPALSPLLLAVALIAVIVLAFGSEQTDKNNYIHAGITIISFCIVLYFFGISMGWFGELPKWVVDPIYQGVIITVLIIGTLVGWVSTEK